MWAACCLGFFAFLRSGEFTVQSNETYDPSWHLSVQDVAVDSVDNPSVLQVGIKGSKTDQWRHGIFLMVGRTEKKICPVKAMLGFLAVRGFKSGPLFRFRDGTPLSRQQFVKRLREILCAAGVDCTHFSGHSFRIGAATAAAARGVAESTIQTLGRWSSDSYKRYIRIPRAELAKISAQLVQ